MNWYRNRLPPESIATRTMPHDQMSAAVALYGRTKISGATYGSVPHRLSSSRSLPLILCIFVDFVQKIRKLSMNLTIHSRFAFKLNQPKCLRKNILLYLNMVAMPKSEIFKLSWSSSNRFSGLMSRCATPLPCKYATPSMSCLKKRFASSIDMPTSGSVVCDHRYQVFDAIMSEKCVCVFSQCIVVVVVVVRF